MEEFITRITSRSFLSFTRIYFAIIIKIFNCAGNKEFNNIPKKAVAALLISVCKGAKLCFLASLVPRIVGHAVGSNFLGW